MIPELKFSVVLGTASMVAILSATYGRFMFSIPGFHLKPGESFSVKINITGPEEFSLAKIVNMGGQEDISQVFLQYIKHEGLINMTHYDSRISFIGNASLGQAWFTFNNVNANDSGTYGVLYKRENSADIFTTTFQVNVTNAYRKAISIQGTESVLICGVSPMSLDLLLFAMMTAVTSILMQPIK